MGRQAQQRIGLLQGTLDMFILRTLLYGPTHGHQIGEHIQGITNEFLQMQHGSLYPALDRLEERGWVRGKWETAPDLNYSSTADWQIKAGSNLSSKNRSACRWPKL
jgi:PadR family transcriptional regulator PadR